MMTLAVIMEGRGDHDAHHALSAKSHVYLSGSSVTYLRVERGGFYSPCRLLAPSEPMLVAISMEGSDPLSMSTIGTPNAGNVSAFTQGNDLPWNPQTLFSCWCAME